MAQINYVSKNQLHWTANLNFDLIYKKAKHCWTLTINFLFPFSWYFFLIMFCFLLNWQENSNYFKIAVWLSDSIKRNFRGLIFTTTNYKKQYCLGHIISLAKLNLCLHTYNFIIKGKFFKILPHCGSTNVNRQKEYCLGQRISMADLKLYLHRIS